MEIKENVVYEIMEWRSCNEHYSWGLFITEELAKEFLKIMGWLDCEDFDIKERKIVYQLIHK